MPEGIQKPNATPTDEQRARDRAWATIAARNGLSNARELFSAARTEGVGVALAAALFEKESRGRNVVGHDRDGKGCYIFPAGDGEVRVTEALYREYKRRRVASGNKAMQGFGPAQLTWWELQDQADALGGCWKVGPNARVGLRRLRGLVLQHGLEGGLRRYNGAGVAAEAYARDVLAKREVWQRKLGIN